MVPTSPPHPPEEGILGRSFVRVLGTRLGRFVEFEFSVNGPDLSVELVMPFAAFEEFCRDNKVTVLPPAAEAASMLEQLAWRDGRPGLYKSPHLHADAG